MLFKHSNMPVGCSEYMFEGQNILQLICFGCALLCIPVMLFGKPLYIIATRARKLKNTGKVLVSDSVLCNLSADADHAFHRVITETPVNIADMRQIIQSMLFKALFGYLVKKDF